MQLFRRVEGLRLSADGTRVDAIELIRQVDLAAHVTEYAPTTTVGGVVSWPSEPDWSQIADGDAIRDRLARAGFTLESAWCREQAGRETLVRGQDFDAVVLGISVAELRRIAGELIDRHPAWRATWDWAIFVGSLVPALLWGVALGSLKGFGPGEQGRVGNSPEESQRAIIEAYRQAYEQDVNNYNQDAEAYAEYSPVGGKAFQPIILGESTKSPQTGVTVVERRKAKDGSILEKLSDGTIRRAK